MNRLLLFCVLLTASWSAPAAARKGKNAIRKPDNVGMGLGTNGRVTGVSGKYYVDRGLSAQAVVGTWGLDGQGPPGLKLAASADGLLEFPVVAKYSAFKVAPIAGASGWIRMATDLTEIGAGAVVGVSLLARKQPVSLSLEYRPTYGIINVPKDEALDLIGFGMSLHYVIPARRLRR